jgi:hypothetical protein
MNRPTPQSDANTLKNMDFLTWQVKQVKRTIHKDEVNRLFNGRTRLRSKLHVN